LGERLQILVDDVGSFPLPIRVSREVFERAYVLSRDAIINGKDIRKNEFLLKNFYEVVVDSFVKKIKAGLDVVTYPQHYDMHKQFLDALKRSIEQGTYLIEEKDAILPEVHVINEEAKRLSEELGKKVQLRVCVTGPLELYLKQVGTVVYRDILEMFAESVRRFAKNSVLNSKYVETVAVSLDEPSFGFQDISVDREAILVVLERAFDFNGAIRQIHLHSPSRIADVLNVKNVDVLSFEYAASPRNIESVSKKMLDAADKQIRVGVARTDVDSIMAEFYDKGITKPSAEQMAESVETIQKRFTMAKEKYEQRMTFTGPDCGLGGWPTQEAAQLLLQRTVKAVNGLQ